MPQSRVGLKKLRVWRVGWLTCSAYESYRFSLFLPQPTETFFAIKGLDAAALDVIIAGIKGAANLRQFGEITGHSVSYEVLRRATYGSGKFPKTRFGFWGESDYHIGL